MENIKFGMYCLTLLPIFVYLYIILEIIIDICYHTGKALIEARKSRVSRKNGHSTSAERGFRRSTVYVNEVAVAGVAQNMRQTVT